MAEEATPVEDVKAPETEDSFDESGDNWDDPDDQGFEAEEAEETKEEESEQSDDTDSDEEPAEDLEEEADVAEAEEPEAKEEEDTTSDVEPSESEQTQKQLAHEAFKRREAERQLREVKQKQTDDNLQRYLDEAKDDEDLHRERQTEVKEYYLTKKNSEVLERSLEVDMKLAVAELGLKGMDEATSNFVQRRLDEFENTRVIRDKNGLLLDVKGDVYQYLKEELDSISHFKGIGAREQTKKKTVEKAMTIPKASRTPKEPAKDQDLDDFDKAFYG